MSVFLGSQTGASQRLTLQLPADPNAATAATQHAAAVLEHKPAVRSLGLVHGAVTFQEQPGMQHGKLGCNTVVVQTYMSLVVPPAVWVCDCISTCLVSPIAHCCQVSERGLIRLTNMYVLCGRALL